MTTPPPAQQGGQLVHHLEVVKPERSGFRHQDAEIRVHDALHHRAGAPRRAVDDGQALRLFQHRPDHCLDTGGLPESLGCRSPPAHPRVPTSRRPTGFSVSVTAPAGQTSWQPPQLWHTSGNTVGFFPNIHQGVEAAELHAFLQPVQAAASNSGRREMDHRGPDPLRLPEQL